MAYRARKSLQSTAADKATWIKKLSDRAYLTYSALIRVSEHIAMHYWSMYVDCGIEFVEAELNLIGSAIGIVITDATEHGSQELTNAGHQYWFIQPDIVTVTTQ